MSTINERIKELNVESLSGHTNRYSYGGLCDEATYAKTECKTLFLLKEVNGQNGEEPTSLAQHLNNQANGKPDHNEKYVFYRMWRNVARWMKVIENPNITYNEVDKQSIEQLREALKTTGAINIKKTFGNSESNSVELLEYIDNPDRQKLIRDEIKTIMPRLVICGGTFEYAMKVYGIQENDIQINRLTSGTFYFIKNIKEEDDKIDKRVCFIKFVHPSYMVELCILFAYFKDFYHAFTEEIIQKRLC